MPSIVFRVNFFIFKLANYILYYFIPENLRPYLLRSWYDDHDDQQHQQGKDISSLPNLGIIQKSQGMSTDELKKVFKMFDRDKDEMITKDELKDSMLSMGIFAPDKELDLMIDKVDMNGDGCIDMDEFKALYQTIMDMNDDGNSIEVDIMEAFDVFDQNRDGFISAEELKSVLESLGHRREVEDCEKMIKRVDEDGDGMVNFIEFKKMLDGGFTPFTN